MIRHFVLFNLKPGVEDSDRQDLFDQILKMSELPSVGRLRLGRLLEPRDAAYRDRMSGDFEHALMVEFEDEDRLYDYQKDPLHAAVAQQIRARAGAVKVMDFVTNG